MCVWTYASTATPTCAHSATTKGTYAGLLVQLEHCDDADTLPNMPIGHSAQADDGGGRLYLNDERRTTKQVACGITLCIHTH